MSVGACIFTAHSEICFAPSEYKSWRRGYIGITLTLNAIEAVAVDQAITKDNNNNNKDYGSRVISI